MADVPDFTSKFNTKLSPVAEQKFQRWLRETGREADLRDYDLRGAWLTQSKQADNGHFTDKYKKPNHPTFSDESIYSGKDGYAGGHWSEKDGKWSYAPSETNLKFRTHEELDDYFVRDEPDSSIAWDALTKPK